MIPRDVKSPTVAIPFNRLLKVVAICLLYTSDAADEG